MKTTSRNYYRKRKHLKIRQKIHGSAEAPRLSIFKSLRHIEGQLINDDKRQTLAYASTRQLKLKHGANLEGATKVGQILGEKVVQLGVKKVVFDRSGYIYHGKVKAFADAVRDKGVKF
ncbi:MULTISPECIES: 50S ribosomal protein L18 [unclassified Mycoplasma]|uniref:50S ribosomal protein L18 n=1 Tax=unclassified Mycoplasma TaxID=2683645 RepID=UPI000FDD9578